MSTMLLLFRINSNWDFIEISKHKFATIYIKICNEGWCYYT